MRHAVLMALLVLAAASSAAAQSCATLGAQLDCGGGTKRAQPPHASAGPSAGNDAVVEGHAETTLSNRGTDTTLHNRVIDSHGMMEFGFRGSTGCRRPGYGPPCE